MRAPYECDEQSWSQREHNIMTISIALVSAFMTPIAACGLFHDGTASEPLNGESAWTQFAGAQMPASNAVAAYDNAAQAIVALGQENASAAYHMWTFDGAAWNIASNDGIFPSLDAEGLAFDTANNKMLYVGNFSAAQQAIDQTWINDGNGWQQPTVSQTPTGFGLAMTYDSVHQQAIVFGGAIYTSVDESTYATRDFAETMLWNGSDWTTLHPATSPSARDSASITFDDAHGNVVLFGGQDETGRPLHDTWTWDGTTWTEQHPVTSPQARSGAAMAFDPARGETVLFGGTSGSVYFGDTWTWDGSNWSSHAAAGPSARTGAQLVFDVAHNRLVMFGGYVVNTDGTTISQPDTWWM